MPSTLYIVATPIGNLEDMTYRAVRILREVDLIAVEDTRHSRKLLEHFGVDTPMMSFHEHNEDQRLSGVLSRLEAGESVALISDAGTPLISDPGFSLVREARRRGLTVSPIPGASSVAAGLSVAGLPTDRFVYEGFLPAKPASRRKRLEALKGETRTLVVLESSHRIRAALADLVHVFGSERVAALERELTKHYETVRMASLGELAAWLERDPNQCKGEFVVIIDGASEVDAEAARAEAERWLEVLVAELPVKKAATLVAKATGQPKNALYSRALALSGKTKGNAE